MFYNDGKLVYCAPMDLSRCTSMNRFMWNCKSIEEIPHFDTARVKSFQIAFLGCAKLKKLPNFDYSSATDLYGMCSGTTSLKEIEATSIVFPQATTARDAFMNSGLIDVPSMSFPNCVNATKLFYGIPALEGHWGTIELPVATNMTQSFQDCKFESCPLVSCPKVILLNNTFYRCRNLKTIPRLDCENVTDYTATFGLCASLTSILQISGIKKSVAFSASPLDKDTLLRIIDALQEVTGQTLTLGATNLAKLTDEEKAVATDKGWTLN